MNFSLFLTLFVLYLFYFVESKIEEVTGSNIQKLQNEGKFMLIFVTKEGCEECRVVYPKFVSSSQTFDTNEIMFGRIQHHGLAAKLDVESFPSLIYYKANSKKVNRARIDITVDSIVQLISDVTERDFTYKDKHYTIELTQGNYDEILNTPNQFKLVLLYTKGDKERVEWFDDLAEKYKNDDKIIFCRLNTYLEGNIRGKFKAKQFPVMYWFSDDEIPTKSIYGGRFDVPELMGFISDKTGVEREKDGTLPETAGVLKDFEKLITTNSYQIVKAKDMKGVIQKAKDMAELLDDKTIAEYYVYLLEEIAWHEDNSVIDDERYHLLEELAKENGPKKKELLQKKQNVVRGVIDILGAQLLKRNSKESPIVKKKEPRPHKHNIINRHEEL